MKQIIFAFAAGIFLYACSATSPNPITDGTSNIPTLLDRSEKIQLGKEWDYVQNLYSEQKLKIQKNESDFNAHLTLAELFVKEARVTGEHGHYYPAALAMTNQVIKNAKDDQDLRFRALVTKAGVQLSLHEFNDALVTAEEALKLNSQNAQIFGVLVDCYVELGQYEKAVKSADRMIAIKPDIRSYSRISYLREIHGDIEGSMTAMKIAVEAGYPSYEETAWAMLTLGNLYQEYGDLDTAEKIYKEILEVRPDYPFAVAGIGEVAFAKGDMALAEAKLKEAIAIIPEVGFYVQLATLKKKQNDNKAFNELMKEVFEMLADDEKSGHNMNLEYASIYLNLYGDYDKALEYTEKEYVKRPDNIDVNRLMALIKLEQDAKEAAISYLAAAEATNSKHPQLDSIRKKI